MNVPYSEPHEAIVLAECWHRCQSPRDLDLTHEHFYSAGHKRLHDALVTLSDEERPYTGPNLEQILAVDWQGLTVVLVINLAGSDVVYEDALEQVRVYEWQRRVLAEAHRIVEAASTADLVPADLSVIAALAEVAS